MAGKWQAYYSSNCGTAAPRSCQFLLIVHEDILLSGWDLLQRPWEQLAFQLEVQEYSFVVCDSQQRQSLLRDQLYACFAPYATSDV